MKEIVFYQVLPLGFLSPTPILTCDLRKDSILRWKSLA